MLTSFARGAKSKLARICLGASMLIGSGCALDLLPRFAQPGFYRDYKDGEVRDEERVSQKRNNGYPILFTAKNDHFEGIGKQIFYFGEGVYVLGNFNGIIPEGTRIANKNVYLQTMKKTHFTVKSVKVGEFDFIRGRFDAQDLAENFGTGEYENTWYADIDGEWKEIGSIRYAIFGDNKSASK